MGFLKCVCKNDNEIRTTLFFNPRMNHLFESFIRSLYINVPSLQTLIFQSSSQRKKEK